MINADYGLKIQGISARAALKPVNKFNYQGDFSEQDDESQYNEFALRNYDAQIGRWIQTDPYNEFASGYTGMGNDPVNYIDPSGGASIGSLFGIGGLLVSKSIFNSVLGRAVMGAIGNLINNHKPDDWIRLSNGTIKFDERVNSRSSAVALYGKDVTYLGKETELFDVELQTQMHGNADGTASPKTMQGVMVSAVRRKQSNWYETGGKVNWYLGTGASIFEVKGGLNVMDMYARGVRRGVYGNYQLTGRNLNLFKNTEMTSATKPISKIGRIGGVVGRASFWLGVLMDAKGVINYRNDPNSPNAVHPAKAVLNTGMGAYGTWVNPVVGIVYFGVDAFYPGGWPAALEKRAEIQKRDREILGFYPKD